MLCHTRSALLKTDEWLEKERQAEADQPTPAPKDAALRTACTTLQKARSELQLEGIGESDSFKLKSKGVKKTGRKRAGARKRP